MMIGVFTLYLIAMIAMIAKKRPWAISAIWLGLLLAGFLLWFHATDKIGINL
jgi:hypothetical protein